MSLFSRLFGGREEDHYLEGLTLFEQGRFAEASERFRRAAARESSDPKGSLADFYLRQSLTAEGRRLLVAGRAAQALPYLEEAAALWDAYPDIQFLHGTALGLTGRWEDAIARARVALRANPEYLEANLLEAAGLVALDRRVEAAARLAHLVETGRDTEHWVVVQLRERAPFEQDRLPDDLEALLVKTAGGRAEKEDLAAAVTLCRAGAWAEGLERLTELVAKHPRYPDYRVKRAAALYQLHRVEEAVTETDAALVLNQHYRAARLLGGLLRAEQGRFEAAYRFLGDSPAPREKSATVGHEELFGAYLRAVLALLTGRWEEVDGYLAGWHNLERMLAPAVLLRAAAADLAGRPDLCTQHLELVVATWPAEPDYAFLLAGHLLEIGREDELTRLLSRWPVDVDGGADARPLYLAGKLAVRSGWKPDLVQPPDDPRVPTAAWDILRAEAALASEDPATALEIGMALCRADTASEIVDAIVARAARELGALGGGEALDIPPVWPDRVVVEIAPAWYREGQTELATATLARIQRVQPERPAWSWLTPGFWLGPIRGWIG